MGSYGHAPLLGSAFRATADVGQHVRDLDSTKSPGVDRDFLPIG